MEETVYLTPKHYETLWKVFTLASGGLKKVMAFVLLYVQGKMLEEKRKNAPFRLQCWGCNLSYTTWKRSFQFQLVWREMGWWKILRALLKCKMLPVHGMAQKGSVREVLWLRYSMLPGQSNETLLLRFTSLANRLQTSIRAWLQTLVGVSSTSLFI